MKLCSRFVIGLLAAALLAAPAAAQQRSQCALCHGELEYLRQNTDSMARARAVLVLDTTVANSAHAELSCQQCHTDFGSFPHRTGATKACSSCHEKPNEKWLQGAHATQAAQVGVACHNCHGVHDTRSAAALKTKAGIARMNRQCVGCHQTERLALGSPHADSALCSGCHGAHDTRPAYDRDSRLWANQQLQTCGTCHIDITRAWSRDDVHAQALLSRRPIKASADVKRRAPACTDCHGGHGMVVHPDSTLERTAFERCAECHEHQDGSYIDSYHGQAVQLGSGQAASCADCHSAHTILPTDDPRSTVAARNVEKTCANCHGTATAGFISFDPHADHHDKSNPAVYWTYTFMTLLLIGTMSFFGLHTILWMIRLGIEGRRRKRAVAGRQA
jgi:predicted CXXCH cytochrome family protein